MREEIFYFLTFIYILLGRQYVGGIGQQFFAHLFMLQPQTSMSSTGIELNAHEDMFSRKSGSTSTHLFEE